MCPSRASRPTKAVQINFRASSSSFRHFELCYERLRPCQIPVWSLLRFFSSISRLHKPFLLLFFSSPNILWRNQRSLWYKFQCREWPQSAGWRTRCWRTRQHWGGNKYFFLVTFKHIVHPYALFPDSNLLKVWSADFRYNFLVTDKLKKKLSILFKNAFWYAKKNFNFFFFSFVTWQGKTCEVRGVCRPFPNPQRDPFIVRGFS